MRGLEVGGLRVFDKSWWKRWRYLLGLTVVVGWLFLVSWERGTWLSGWDTLHPEFDFGLYFERSVFGAWQEHQGLGAAAAQAAAAELPRVVGLWLMSWVVGDQMLRWVFMFLMLWLGVVGMYGLVKCEGLRGKRQAETAAFLAALFYLLNLVVVQLFAVPLEMFAVAYAVLPWWWWAGFSYLRRGGWRRLAALGVVGLLASSMAHTATLFYMLAASMAGAGLVWVLGGGEKVRVLRRVVASLVVVVGVNLFWIFPNLYFIVNHSQEVVDSRIHSNFSDEARLQSSAFGTLGDLVLLRNFWFDWRVYDFETESFVNLLGAWNEHVDEQLGVRLVGYGLFGVVVMGAVVGRRSRLGLVAIYFYLVGGFFLINDNFPFERIFSWLNESVPLSREGLRFPFTKVGLMTVSAAAVLSGFGFEGLLEWAGERRRKWVVGTAMVALGLWSLPMFGEGLVAESVKVEIPQEYFEMFAWFKDQPREARVARLPIHSFWGWVYHDWGYEGAGFTWFGMAQPTLDREFDRWNRLNEGFYNQMSFAVYDRDTLAVERVLSKYRVGYLVLDKSIINAGGEEESLLVEATEDLLTRVEGVELAAEFGFIKVYRNGKVPAGFVRAGSGDNLVEVETAYAPSDWVYGSLGEYVGGLGGTVYPFGELDRKSGVEVELEGEMLWFRRDLEEPVWVERLEVPSLVAGRGRLPVTLQAKREGDDLVLKFLLQEPEVRLDGEEVFLGGGGWVEETVPGAGLAQWVSVAGKAFGVSGVGEEFAQIGYVDVSRDDVVEVGVFRSQVKLLAETVDDLLREQPRECLNPDRKREFTRLESREFSLTVKNESVCLGKTFEVEADGLLEIAFVAESEQGLFPWVCVTRVGSTGCVNDVLPGDLGRAVGRREYQFQAEVEAGEYWIDFVARGVGDLEQSIAYRDVRLLVRDEIARVEVPIVGEVERVAKEGKVEVDRMVESVELGVGANLAVSEDFNLLRGSRLARNCDLFERGSVEKAILIGGGVRLLAEDSGVGCDFYEYNSLAYNQAYLLRLTGENISGRSLKAYLFNQEKRKMEVEDVLGTGKFEENFLLAPKASFGRGYTLNLENRSFGRVTADNVIDEVSFWRLPLAQIVGARLVSGEERLDGSGMVLTGERRSSAVYEVLVGGSGVAVLDQAYEEGWSAYVKRAGRPWWLGEELEQVTVNGWANGWIVDRDEGSESRVIVVYWPQYWQWGGLIVGTMILSLLAWKGWRER